VIPTPADLEPNTTRFHYVDSWGYYVHGQPMAAPTAPLPLAAIPDLAGGADLPTTVAKVNAILAALRSAGIVAP
jgi:hypothetical protein